MRTVLIAFTGEDGEQFANQTNKTNKKERKTMDSFHKSNLGTFGTSLPCDMDGYVHRTAEAWKNARVDFAGEKMTDDQLDEWAQQMAAEAIEATEKAERALTEWRRQNW